MRLLIAGAVLLVAIGGWLLMRPRGSNAPAYRFATAARGNIEAAVSATGTLAAVTTVQVGTQVSGQIAAIYADFNDRVKRGQLIARIDPTLQQQAVQDAEAGLERSQAEVLKAESDYARDSALYASQSLTRSDFAATQYALASAHADAKSAQVTLDKARQNLLYTSIYAPIDGIVVQRNVDVGQTVAASLQAPQLFLIANDLSQMEILASVDESDIGQIHQGQAVHFTVAAYPEATFRGTVRQVRLQSTTVENVVNYTVVVAVTNPQRKLLPGMTATAAFVTGSATDVLMVPNAALRFRPTGGVADTIPTLWYLTPQGRLASVHVTPGLSDGQRTAVQGGGVTAGMRVITAAAGGAPTGGTASPFQGSPQGPGRRVF
ncbi:MAG TPA: efflux RND transporter periplasmic adaptor subunit [Gemmatimonadales bacterium]|nr:efflux RND transporter periplasmic adaptor subunit [Gemmatimonadales bacterium]